MTAHEHDGAGCLDCGCWAGPPNSIPCTCPDEERLTMSDRERTIEELLTLMQDWGQALITADDALTPAQRAAGQRATVQASMIGRDLVSYVEEVRDALNQASLAADLEADPLTGWAGQTTDPNGLHCRTDRERLAKRLYELFGTALYGHDIGPWESERVQDERSRWFAHADRLLASDEMKQHDAEVRAEAWDEGHRNGHLDCRCYLGHVNPYRAALAEEGGDRG